MTTLRARKSIGPAAAERGYFLIGVALACFGFLPQTQAVSPAPDGGYPGGTTAEGNNALNSLTSGLYNTAVGDHALSHNTTASANTATGYQALYSNTTVNGIDGHANTATGFEALFSNTTGGDNTATGFGALANNITGDGNTAHGYNTLVSNTSGGANTATGENALYSNTTGVRNTADGQNALYSNTIGIDNTAYGVAALQNATGSYNIALGYSAGFNLTASNHNIDIGNRGVAAESNVIRIGTEGTQDAAYIAGIFQEVVGPNHLPVLVDSTGKLGTMGMSSRQFKKEIKPMNKTSEAILALKPVTFRYKDDKTNTPQFGLIAEEVGKVDPDLVVRDKNGEIFTVRYEAVNAMLLNEFLKEHRKIEEQDTTITQLKSTVANQETTAAKQQKEIKALTASLQEHASQIQKVSAQLEMSKAASQTALNNP